MPHIESRWWEELGGVMVVVQREAKLLEVASALSSTGSLTSLLHSREQQCDQDGDNRDDHQQFDECERFSTNFGPGHQKSPKTKYLKKRLAHKAEKTKLIYGSASMIATLFLEFYRSVRGNDNWLNGNRSRSLKTISRHLGFSAISV